MKKRISKFDRGMVQLARAWRFDDRIAPVREKVRQRLASLSLTRKVRKSRA